MLKYKFLRNTFILAVLVAILLPLFVILYIYPAFSAALAAQTEQEAVRIGRHLAEMIPGAEGASPTLLITQELVSEADLLAHDFNIFKYRIFSSEGKILHSTDPDEIGRLNERGYFHRIVALGHVFTKTVIKEGRSQEGELFDRSVVETYVPIMDQGQFLGAFELYFDITTEQDALDRLTARASLVLGAIGTAFLLVVFLVRRSVVKNVGQVTQAMSRMAQGDLGQSAQVTAPDELGDMARAFNTMASELKKAHNGLKDERNKLTTILLSAREGIVVTDADHQVALVNPSAQRLLGKSEERIAEEGFAQLIDDPDFVAQFLSGGRTDMPETVVFNQRVLNFYAATIHNQERQAIGSAALIRDVTEEKRLEAQLRDLSYTDGLTGLLNRRRMEEVLHEECRRAQRYGVDFGLLMFDVDHFKRFNDQHGHDQGDRVLVAVGAAMREHFRTVDYCCRYGGEEFCIIMPNTIVPGLVEAADRFRIKIERMVVDELRVTISIGVALFSQAGENNGPEVILKMADEALYAAKGAGRNRVMAFQSPQPAAAPDPQPNPGET